MIIFQKYFVRYSFIHFNNFNDISRISMKKRKKIQKKAYKTREDNPIIDIFHINDCVTSPFSLLLITRELILSVTL